MTPGSTPVVAAEAIRKEFTGQVALDGVSIEVLPGQVHALVGTNGSGKSTLVKVLAGVYTPEAGDVLVDGEPVGHLTPARATELGLRFIHQDPALFTQQTVRDNISIGSRFRTSHGLRVDDRGERVAAWAALAAIGVDTIDPDARLGELSQSQRTMVAVARAVQDLQTGATIRLLVLDEPTASLPEDEAQRVFQVIRDVAAHRIGVIYISHDLSTLLAIADHVTVLRDGKLVASRSSAGLDEGDLAQLMVGDVAARTQPAGARAAGPAVLTCRDLHGGRLRPTSLQVRAGEILGVAGLLGSGRSTMLRLISGGQPRDGGEVLVRDAAVPSGRPGRAVAAGIAYVPEDRRKQAGFATMSMRENITAGALGPVSTPLRIDEHAERTEVAALLDEFDVKPRDPEREFRFFSGGNQQKGVIARCARLAPDVLLLDEPTQGVDVRARAQIHDSIRLLAERGTAVVVVSSDFGEVLDLADRVVVMRQGAVKAVVEDPSSIEEHDLHHLAGTV
ncbi:sugar ABC transporter ATP-binding protein [Pseudonocardia sp. H11422]|uniref:sugar ABC transporter ATP-binding protein n=1 Tax=Pseudonocardia sp. H11422 TaxID=2835866 RepID=UPI001BDC5F38|nr:sugar ABC transporter ATP-binding protein [Pseudonocardia sp. H11422]